MAKRILTLRNGYWSKKIRGKTHYFGKDYDQAVLKFRQVEPFLKAGLQPPSGSGAKLSDLLNGFLNDCLERNLSPRTVGDYHEVCKMIAEVIPLGTLIKSLSPDEFKLIRNRLTQGKAKNVSPKTLDRRLGYARAVFRFASIDNRYLDFSLPFSKSLASVPKYDLRKHRSTQPARMLTAEEIRKLIGIGCPKYKAMILLGINGGFNNSDIGGLELSRVQPVPDVLIYHRRKTFFERRTPLWEETKTAIREAIEDRVTSNRPELFLTSTGRPYAEGESKQLISGFFYGYLKRLKIYSPGKNFGALRTTFSNVGKEVGDDIALKALMGHSDGSMLYESYADGVFVPRLKKITDHVRDWLNL